MPKIPIYGPSRVTTEVGSIAKAPVMPAGQGFAVASQALGIAGKVYGAYQQMQQEADVLAAEDALTNFERDRNTLLFNPETGYFNTQGRDAYDGHKDAADQLVKLQEQYGSKLESDVARRAFVKAANRISERSRLEIMKHAQNGLESWQNVTAEAQIENTIENGMLHWNDDKVTTVQHQLGRTVLMEKLQRQGVDGIALNEQLQTYDSKFTTGQITAALNSSSIEAQALFDKKGSMLEGPDRLKLEKAIKAKRDAEETKAQAGYAVIKATNLVNRYDARSDIIEEVNKIQDPELRKKTMTESMTQFTRKQQAEAEERGDIFNEFEKQLMKGGTVQDLQAKQPEQWHKLSAQQQKQLIAGKIASTNYSKLSDLLLLSKAELAKVNPADHFHELAPGDRMKLISAVKTARGVGSASEKASSQIGRTRIAETNAAIEQIFGPKKKQDIAQVNAFHAIVDDEAQLREQELGRKLTSNEYTELLAGLTRKIVVERPWYWPDVEKELKDVPAEDLTALSEYLQKNGIPVTADNMIKAYEQAKD